VQKYAKKWAKMLISAVEYTQNKSHVGQVKSINSVVENSLNPLK